MNTITIDIDEPYDEFIKSWRFDMLKCKLHPVQFVAFRCIRRSSRSRVHLRIGFSISLDLFETFLLRAYLGDDPVRIACDLSRYYRTKKEGDTGRCFSQKYVDGKLVVVGEWERF